jgi:hypothetical protein
MWLTWQSLLDDVDELYVDTWHTCGRMLGCHVAQSRAATWHPGFDYLVLGSKDWGRPGLNR